MRIIFVNLHCNVFYLKPLDFILKKRTFPTYKHVYILKYLLKENKKVAIYINSKGTTAPKAFEGFKKYKLFRRFECYFVLINNGINPFKIQIIEDYKDIDRNDILIGNYYYPDNFENLEKISCYKALIMNHFVYLNSNPNLAQYRINCVVSEADLTVNGFFNKYFKYDKAELYTLPYIFQERFKFKNPYRNRANKAVAVGTSTYCDNKEFLDFFHTRYLQPMRQTICENKEEVKEFIDSYISSIVENNEKSIQDKDNTFIKYYKKIFNYFHGDRQIKYFSFDMVEKFNEYKMFICPEEITGIPGIGFVEGMACGCAYIGLDNGVYNQFGMTPGVHYIGYDGTLEDLVDKIKYYQTHNKELSAIAEKGYRLIRNNFNTQSSAKRFYEDLYERVGKYDNIK